MCEPSSCVSNVRRRSCGYTTLTFVNPLCLGLGGMLLQLLRSEGEVCGSEFTPVPAAPASANRVVYFLVYLAVVVSIISIFLGGF